MANMSYCRVRNTLEDLRDCYDNMDEEPSLPGEKKARAKRIVLCREIVEDYGEEEA